MTGKCKIILEHIENLILYLQPLLPLANSHMVDYFSKEIYKKNVPISIQEDIDKIGKEDVINCILNGDYTKLPNLLELVEKSRQFTLKNNSDVCMSMRDFHDKLKEWGCEDFHGLKLEIFMTSKKSHEVDILSSVVAAVRNVAGTSHIIDIGDGKGYLSSMLALHHKIPVLGVDASAINTNSAVTRVRKLSRIWNSVVNEENRKAKETTAKLYKQVTQFVHEEIDFNKLISNVFLENANGLSLVGLHTCGNLAATSIKIFNASQDIKSICNVGCCYHLITETYENNANKNELERCGFPMSKYLKDKHFVIGRAARMIAAQSVDRILSKKELPNKTIFYRALFEILISRKCSLLTSDKKQVGRFRKECNTFQEYVRIAAKRINLEAEISDEEIDNLYKEYEDRIAELNVFFLIRSMLSPIIESLILLDRLLFLQEEECEQSFLVQCFDPVISPRCYGLIALKQN